VMIWVPDAARAIALAAQAVAEVGTREDLLPVRVGVHTGAAVMSGWDWYGSAVNLAARLATKANPNEALISSATLLAAGTQPRHALCDARQLTLRGMERPVVAWPLTGAPPFPADAGKGT
jgi:adenylate cyclase